jgi:RNA polymerase sigma-70 factor (sigma-E family)
MAHDGNDEFLTFFASEFRALRRLGFLLTGDWGEAEELAQEAMVRTFAAWEQVRHYQQPAAFARKVLLNRHRSLLRRAVVEARHALRTEPNEAQPLPFSGEELVLWQALRQLPTRQCHAIVLRFCLDLPEAEVARQLGVPAGTVKSMVHRGLQRLRAQLDPVYHRTPSPDSTTANPSTKGARG